MKINLLTDTTTLIEAGVLSGRARNACGALMLNDVQQILSIPVKTIEQITRLTKQPLVEFCRLHEAFANRPESVESDTLVKANKSVKQMEYTRLYKTYSEHVLPRIVNENGLSENSILNLYSNFSEKYDECVARKLSDMYNDDVYNIASDITGLGSHILNLSSKNTLMNVWMRNLATDLLEYASSHLMCTEKVHEYLLNAYQRMNHYGSYQNALDLYNGMDKIEKRILADINHSLVDKLYPSTRKHLGLRIYDVTFAIDGIYHPYPDYARGRLTKTEKFEYQEYLNSFRNILESRISYYYRDDQDKCRADISLQRMLLRYPYLTEDECRLFIIDGRESDVPDLYLYVKHLMRDSDPHTIIRREAAGLNEQGVERSLREISDMVNLSVETVRKVNAFPHVFKRFERSYRDRLCSMVEEAFDGFESDAISCAHPAWKRLIDENKLDISVRQLMLTVKTMFRCCDVYTSDNGLDYFLPYTEAKWLPLKTVEHTFTRMLGSKRNFDTEIDLHKYFGNHSDSKIEGMSIIFEDYVANNPRVKVIAPLRFAVSANKVDWSAEIVSILKEAGHELNADEIRNRLIAKFPEEDEITVSAVKSILSRNELISAKGLTGYYVLNEWDGHFKGTITEYLFKKLMDCDKSLSVDELTDHAKLMFPTTSKKSVATLLAREVPRRFIRLSDNHYRANKEYVK